jgi:hypothetical protein
MDVPYHYKPLGEVGLTFLSMKLICLLEAVFLPKNPKNTEHVNG